MIGPVKNFTFEYNISTINFWRQRLASLSIPLIKRRNYPKTIDTTYLERSLFYNPMVVGFVVPDVGPVVLKGFGTDLPNVYDIPTRRTVTAANGFTVELDNDNSFIIYNNEMRYASVIEAEYYAGKLAQLDSLIDINLAAQKTPWIIQTDPATELALRNMFAQIDNGERAIYADQDLDIDRIKVLNTQAPMIFRDARVMQQNYLSDYLLSQGCVPPDVNKAERLNVAEVLKSTSGVTAAQETKLKPRREFDQWLMDNAAEYLDGEPETYYDEGAMQLLQEQMTQQRPFDETIDALSKEVEPIE